MALFPGYVFCHFDSNRRLPILVTPGIVGVVGLGNKPEPVDDSEMARRCPDVLFTRGLFLRSGQGIRLHSGPLMGAE
jgi:transcription antitermination factor NusG